ncbi:hypothetical protein D3C86_2121010 [compost metagenome]
MAANQVVDDRRGLDQRLCSVFNDRRFSQRIDRFQFRWREIGFRVALITFQLVRNSQLFQQPEYALGTGVVQVMHDDHK